MEKTTSYLLNLMSTGINRRHGLMLLLCLLVSFQFVTAQSVDSQTFTVSGYDDDPTVLSISPALITVNEGQPIQNIVITDASMGSASYCDNWYGFYLSITGGVSDGTNTSVCASDLIGIDLTGFSSLSLTSEDLDDYSDEITISLTLQVTYQTPTCPRPEAVVVSAINSVGATLSWTGTAPNYEYVLSTSSSIPDAGTPATGTVSGVTTTFTTLNSITTYYFWVRAVCGAAEVSSWSYVQSFTTECPVYLPDYSNGFSPFPGSCWSRASDGDPSTGPSGTVSYWTEDGFLNDGVSGAARINLYYYNRVGWLISPTFNLSAGGYEVMFDYGVTTFGGTSASNFGSDDVVHFLISTDDGATWTILRTWDVSGSPDNTRNVFSLDLTAYTSATAKFAFYGSAGTVNDAEDFNFYVDNFAVETISTCPKPTDVVVSDITDNAATASWAGSAASYEYYYSSTNTAPAATSSPSGTALTLSASLTGLASNTTYYFWVRSVCGEGSKSAWSFVESFTTDCSVVVPDYLYDFSIFPDRCWLQASGGDASTGPDGTDSYWYEIGFLNSEDSGAAAINLYSDDNTGWLISPTFNLSAGNNQVTFNYGVTEYYYSTPSNFGSDDLVQFLVSSDNGATWTVLKTWDVTDSPSNTSNTFTYDLSAYTSATTKFAFYGSDGLVNDDEDFEFFVDNFAVETTEPVGNPQYRSGEVVLYPNPATSQLFINSEVAIKAASVYSTTGAKLMEVNGNVTTIDVGSLVQGLYIIHINLVDGNTVRQSIIKR